MTFSSLQLRILKSQWRTPAEPSKILLSHSSTTICLPNNLQARWQSSLSKLQVGGVHPQQVMPKTIPSNLPRHKLKMMVPLTIRQCPSLLLIFKLDFWQRHRRCKLLLRYMRLTLATWSLEMLQFLMPPICNCLKIGWTNLAIFKTSFSPLEQYLSIQIPRTLFASYLFKMCIYIFGSFMIACPCSLFQKLPEGYVYLSIASDVYSTLYPGSFGVTKWPSLV